MPTGFQLTYDIPTRRSGSSIGTNGTPLHTGKCPTKVNCHKARKGGTTPEYQHTERCSACSNQGGYGVYKLSMRNVRTLFPLEYLLAFLITDILSCSANENAVKSSKKTIMPRDVLEAISQLELDDFRPRLEAELASRTPLSFTCPRLLMSQLPY